MPTPEDNLSKLVVRKGFPELHWGEVRAVWVCDAALVQYAIASCRNSLEQVYMFHKILVAIDTSLLAKYIFDEALFLAKASKATLMLLHVLSGEEQGRQNIPILPRQDYYPYPMMSKKTQQFNQEQWAALEKEGIELLQSRTEEATLAGVSTEFIQPSGNPGRTICSVARNWGADLIVVGRQGLSGLSEIALGSVSNYVLYNAPCSVLIVQHVLENTEADQDESSEVGASD